MNTRDALKKSFNTLRSVNPSSALDSEVLLAHILKKDRAFLYAHPEKTLTSQQAWRFFALIAKRKKHAPIAYLVGNRSFYGLNFFVNKNVLIPRPETELLIDLARKTITDITPPQRTTIIDIGAGSGCIPLSLRKTITQKNVTIFSTDASTQALIVAKKNARNLGLSRHVTFFKGNLLEPILRKPSLIQKTKHLIITANLPYLTTAQWKKTPKEVKKYEPRMALDGGKDGLKYYSALLQQIKNLPSDISTEAFFEIDPAQTSGIKKLVARYFPNAAIAIHKDLCDKDRVAHIHL